MPPSAAAKQLVLNVTRNSYAFIDSMSGSTATVSQPIPASTLTTPGTPTLAVDNTWTTGDTLSTFTLPDVNLKEWRPVGGDVGEGGAASAYTAGWVQFVHIVDTSGTADSIYALTSDTAANVLSSCQISTRVAASITNGRHEPAYMVGCDITGQVAMGGLGTPEVYGGILRGGMEVSTGQGKFDGDAVTHGTANFEGTSGWVVNAFFDGAINIGNSGSVFVASSLWGSASVNVLPECAYWNESGTTFVASLLTSGQLRFGSMTTGTKYVGGVFTDGVALTQANMDLFNGLQDPNTGARFCNSQ